MTSAMVGDVLLPAGVILFDFDGPICPVFSGHPAPAVARRLEHQLATLTDMSDHGAPTNDPLEVLRRAARYGPTIAFELDQALEQAGLKAVLLATPTPSADRSLEATVRTGRRAAVVTNNAGRAAKTYLDKHGLGQLVSVVVGRVIGRPDFMKPDPHSLTSAVAAGNLRQQSCDDRRFGVGH